MMKLVHADGRLLQRIVATTPLVAHHGLCREAFAKYDAAQAKTLWALRHRRRIALMHADEVLASAERYDLIGRLDRQLVTICGIASVLEHAADDTGNSYAGVLVEQLIEDAARDGADLALLFQKAGQTSPVPDGFAVVPTTDLEITVTESTRYGAPMTLVRGGEDRDLQAIVAMGHDRADPFRFHIERDVDLIKHALTRKRLLAGLGLAGARQLEFVIAEEGITAAAYIAISIVGNTWTIEECGDRDASGARVGAILQALIAREPAESRPVIRGWLPPGFLPPQVTVASASPAPPLVLVRALSPRVRGLQLAAPEVMYWRNDLF
jgi:hypothetical protein